MRTIVYVDVDDTLVRSIGTKRVPIPGSISAVRALKAAGAVLYLWSSGGAEYARASAIDLGVTDCFEAFLPKPMVILDDQAVQEWRGLTQLHPNEGVESVLSLLRGSA